MNQLPILRGNSYRDVSICQTYSLYRFKNELNRTAFSADIEEVKKRAFVDLSAQLTHIRVSLTNRKWTVILWDIITFRFIGALVLSYVLPGVIASVERVERLWRKRNVVPPPAIHIPPRFVPPPVTFYPPGTPLRPVVPEPVRVDPPPPPIDVKQRVEQKFALTMHAYAVLQAGRDANRQEDPQWIAVAKEVNDYFLTTIQKLRANENVPIPMYFHATKNGVDAIAKDKVLKMHHAPFGHGAFFSTRDESHNNYGPFTYAIDPDTIEHFPGSYYDSNHPQHNGEEQGLWVRVERDVPVSGANVAYIAVPDEATKAELIGKFWEGRGGEEIGFYAPVLTRAASDWIRKSFTAVHRHPLPPTWRPLDAFQAPLQLGHIIEPRPPRREY